MNASKKTTQCQSHIETIGHETTMALFIQLTSPPHMAKNLLRIVYLEAPRFCGGTQAAAPLLRRSPDRAGQTLRCAWRGICRGRSSSFDRNSCSSLHPANDNNRQHLD